ncbi:hypothetical protein DOTSEDRAFT_72071 [Dothistroma septosporum NZE10]|uniref:Uncharacterized protein n=1 Tax=Dothistroma septosporum (strain NZE10 / CBS 128990) TaxID=675120 RepID=N1PQ16_DOTSN|nr:hypothetical protein DOTSEDRAFT_72071 [Dothistroma septosporum NZE10]
MNGTAQRQQQADPGGRGDTSGPGPLCPRAPSCDTPSHESQAQEQNAFRHRPLSGELSESDVRDSGINGVEEEPDFVVVEASPQVQDAPRSFAGSTRRFGVSSPRTISDERMSINPAHEAAGTLTSPISTSPANDSNASPTRISNNRDIEAPEEQRRLARIQHNMANMDGAIPENDGMSDLRQKLQDIKMLAVSTEEKAQRMHFLMTQDYMKHKSDLAPSPLQSHASGDLDIDGSASPMLGAAALPIDLQNPYSLRPGDLEPVFSPLPKAPRDVEGDLDEATDDDLPDLGCMHYKRNVKVQCFDCQRWFPCRHCHDHARDLPFAHQLNRKKTQNMLCMLCQTPQPAAETCVNCEEYAAWYYCSKCKLWDNDSNKRIYHCDDCGICRVGEGLGKDYVHCKRCNVCISISTSAAHPCIERATEGNCPLCLVPLFESRTAVVSLPCGHYMHGDCYKDLMAVTYKCPVCSKSAVNMELQWRKLDDEIEAQPMPTEDEDLDGVLPHLEGPPNNEEAAEVQEQNGTPDTRPRRPREVWVGCNDCGARSWTPFHWLGLKCQRCDSYNTNQMAPTAVHETEAERIMRQQQQVHRHDFTGDAVLRDAGIGIETPEEFANSALEAPSSLQVPESPSQQPLLSSSPQSPRLSSGAQSPGRYFVHNEDLRRASFTSSRFSTPSMPNLPTLSNLPDMPRMPRMPNLPDLPNWPNLRSNLPNMPNVELPRFSPYEMIDAVSRSLSPMRYYLRGLDARDEDDLPHLTAHRPASVRSDPERRMVGSKLRTRSEGSEGVESAVLWASEVGNNDGVQGLETVETKSSEGEDEWEEEEDDDDDEEEEEQEVEEDNSKRRGKGWKGRELEELELFGHR